MTAAKSIIPVYDLYGEAHSGAVSGALHAETIHIRAKVNAWNILAHRHARLSQVFFIAKGGGTVEIDGTRHALAAPAVVWLPAGCVHGFVFEPETDGIVLTAAEDVVRMACDLAPDCATRLAAPLLLSPIDVTQGQQFSASAKAVAEEATMQAPGARAAALHHFGLLLILLARATTGARDTPVSSARATYFAFRNLVDQNFRARWSVPLYAKRLGISPDRLHDICQLVAGHPPTHLIQERLMVEARRALIYTGMSIGEIAFDLGFDDPAYFSRFFSKRAGLAPASFRQQR